MVNDLTERGTNMTRFEKLIRDGYTTEEAKNIVRCEELYNTLIEDGFSIEEAKGIRDLVEIEGYSEDAAMDRVLGIN